MTPEQGVLEAFREVMAELRPGVVWLLGRDERGTLASTHPAHPNVGDEPHYGRTLPPAQLLHSGHNATDEADGTAT